MVDYLQHGTGRTGLGIAGAKDQTRYPRMNHGSGAHGARFNCSKHGTTRQTMVAHPGGCFPQGHDFRMGRGVFVQQVAVMAASDDLTLDSY